MWHRLFKPEVPDTLSDAEQVESALLAKELMLTGQTELGTKEESKQLPKVSKVWKRIREILFQSSCEFSKYDQHRIPPQVLQGIKDIYAHFPMWRVHYSEEMALLCAHSTTNTWESKHYEVLVAVWGLGKKAPSDADLKAQARQAWLAKQRRVLTEGIAKAKICLESLEAKAVDVFEDGEEANAEIKTWI